MPDAATSLMQRHPRRFDVPATVFATIVLLGASLALPVLQTNKLFFWEDRYSIWSSIVSLYESDHYVLALVIFVFSIIFPFGKLGGLLLLWFVPMTRRRRDVTLLWLKHLGKWSMLDVFVVAVLIVLTKASDVMDAEAKIGLYTFMTAIIISMLLTEYVSRLAARRDAESE